MVTVTDGFGGLGGSKEAKTIAQDLLVGKSEVHPDAGNGVRQRAGLAL